MHITSDIFKEKELIPPKYTCDGVNVIPPLMFEDVPDNAQSFVLIMDDPDATGGGTFTHWLVWNISPTVREITEGRVPDGAIEGMTDFGVIGYGGPCPPEGNPPHRYFFKLYALDIQLTLANGASKKELENAMDGHTIDEAQFFALYGRM